MTKVYVVTDGDYSDYQRKRDGFGWGYYVSLDGEILVIGPCDPRPQKIDTVQVTWSHQAYLKPHLGKMVLAGVVMADDEEHARKIIHDEFYKWKYAQTA